MPTIILTNKWEEEEEEEEEEEQDEEEKEEELRWNSAVQKISRLQHSDGRFSCSNTLA